MTKIQCLNLALLLTCNGLTSSCKKKADEETDSQNLTAIVSMNDIAKTGATYQMTEQEARVAVTDNSDLYANIPSKSSSSNSCIEDLVNTLKFNVSGRTGFFSGTIDLSNCTRSTLSSNINVSNLNIVYKMLLRFECLSDDIASLNGKGFSEVSKLLDSQAVCKEYNITTQIINENSLAYSAVISGQTYKVEEVNSHYNLVSKADGSPCHYKFGGDSYTVDDCIDTQRTVYKTSKQNGVSGAKEGKEQYVRLAEKNLATATNKPVYFSSGSITIDLGAWSGAITYIAPDKAPNWVLNIGSKQINGTLQPSTRLTGVALADDVAFAGNVFAETRNALLSALKF